MADTKVANLGLLLRCYEGLRNWRALAMLVAGFVVAALLMALNGVMFAHLAPHSFTLAKIVGGLLALIAFLVAVTGVNGTGLMLVDQADGTPSRGFGAAFFGGLGVTVQAIVCLLILAVSLLLVILILWALSFLGKIPGIGPAFAFLLAGPTMLILAACYAVLAFGVSLMFVALWRGNGMLGSLGRAIDIVLKRPLDVVLHFIVLALLIVPIEVFVAAVLFGGSALTGAMYVSSSAVSSYGGYGAYGGYGGGGPLSMLMGGGASLGAAGASIGIVLAAVFALFVLIGMLGNILIYDSLASETAAGSADFLRRKAAQVKARVDENRPKAAPAPAYAAPAPVAPAPRAPAAPTPAAANVQPAPVRAPPAATPTVVPPPPAPAPEPAVVPAAPAVAAAPPQCVHCGAALASGDRFCGECGTAQP